MKNKTKEELLVIVDHLLKEVEILKDENESLWEMLDEMNEADRQAKKLMDEQEIVRLLAKMTPVGDAQRFK